MDFERDWAECERRTAAALKRMDAELADRARGLAPRITVQRKHLRANFNGLSYLEAVALPEAGIKPGPVSSAGT